MADALDDAAGRTHDLDGIESGLDKVGNIVKGSIFWNPIPHMRNVANHYFVDKGLVGTGGLCRQGCWQGRGWPPVGCPRPRSGPPRP